MLLDTFLSVPALLKVLLALASILLVNRFTRNLPVSIAAGTILLALWSGHPLGQALLIAWRRSFSLDNGFMLLLIMLAISLSHLMASSGIMEELVHAIQAGTSRRFSFAALPAVIGLLPMPGGAIFSAPLVDRCDSDSSLDPFLKARINHWFRHIWEYWWPLYPGVILVLQLTGLEIWQLFLLNLPPFVLTLASGAFFLLRRIPAVPAGRDGPPPAAASPFWMLLSPILIVIGMYAGLKTFVPGAVKISSYLPITLGMAAAIIAVRFQRGIAWQKVGKSLISSQALQMVLVVAILRIYGGFIESPLPDGSLMMDGMRRELAALGIPVMVVMMVIPLVSGLAMGITVGTVGASFPIVLSLLGPNPALGALLSATTLSCGFGLAGMLLSPVHVCLVVTCDYFKAGLVRVMSGLLPPQVLVSGMLVLYSLALRWYW